MNIDITILYLFVGLSFGLVAIGYLFRYAIPASLFLFTAGGLMAVLFIYTETISTATFSSGLTDSLFHYNVESSTGSNNVNGAVNSAYVQFVSASNSALVGDTINCIDIQLSKVLSPTGTATIGTFDASNNVLTTFGTIDVSTLTGSSVWKTFCLAGDNTYTIQNQDRIGVKYTGGDATNSLVIRGDGNNPFDGVITFRQFFTAGAWTSTTGTDQMFRFYLSGGDFEITDNEEPFTEEIKVFMVLMASIMCLAGGVMEIEARRR